MGATYELRVDWNNDGDFADVFEDVTDDAKARTPITFGYGRDQARALAPTAAGHGAFELNNDHRRYSPENTSSPLTGLLEPGRNVRLQATLLDVTYPLFRAHLDDFDVLPDIGERAARFTVLDALAKFREVKLSTALSFSITTGQAIGLILDAIGWPAGSRDIDAGATMIRFWWEEGTDAFTALQRVVNSEGPPAIAYVNPSGTLVFRGRHHRLTRTASTSAQATFRGSGSEPTLARPLVYDNGWRDIINSVSFTVDERQPTAELTAVWRGDGVVNIADGETKLLKVVASDPFQGAVAPIAGTDFTQLSGVVTAALSRTSGQSTTIRLTATGGPADISDLQLRAYPVAVARSVAVELEDTTSTAKQGVRSPTIDAPWVGVHDALAICKLILAQRATRLPIVTVRLNGGHDTRLLHQLTRAISDRVRIVEPETGLDADFFIETIAHSTDGISHSTTFACEKVPTQPADVFILGSATRGVLGTNRLGRTGLDDPANVFILGSATNGVLGTNLLGH